MRAKHRKPRKRARDERFADQSAGRRSLRIANKFIMSAGSADNLTKMQAAT
jgi:hypothetical protein